MKKIKLTQNKYAIVDANMYEHLNQYKWYYNNGYACRAIPKGKYKQGKEFMHRMVLQASDGELCDHINQDKLDNRKHNLRKCNSSQNMLNRYIKRGSSGYKGVYWEKDINKYRVRICVNNTKITVGYFKDVIIAAKAYNKAAVKHHGEFAILNQIRGTS